MTNQNIARSMAKLTKDIETLQSSIEAAALSAAHPKLSADIKKLLTEHNLTAAACNGRLTVSHVDAALKASGLKGASAMAAKLELRHAGVM